MAERVMFLNNGTHPVMAPVVPKARHHRQPVTGNIVRAKDERREKWR
jgi:hypothetical protein